MSDNTAPTKQNREYQSALAAEFGKIGSSLNQIAKYFHLGGIRSKTMQDEIHECILKLFELREEVRKMAGDYHGSAETHRK